MEGKIHLFLVHNSTSFDQHIYLYITIKNSSIIPQNTPVPQANI